MAIRYFTIFFTSLIFIYRNCLCTPCDESCVKSIINQYGNFYYNRVKNEDMEEQFPDQNVMLPKKVPKNCEDIRRAGEVSSGVRNIYPFEDSPNRSISAYCDNIDGGGWTVILQREPARVRENFNRGWIDYENGFGNPNGEYWLGLETIFALTNSFCMELRIDMEDYEKEKKFAKYQLFKVGNKTEKYKLTLGDFNGDVVDSFSGSSNFMFTTKDQDNDTYDKSNCAVSYKGGWWYGKCFTAKLTGFPYEGKHESYADGINWTGFKGYNYSLKKASMKLRPIKCKNIK